MSQQCQVDAEVSKYLISNDWTRTATNKGGLTHNFAGNATQYHLVAKGPKPVFLPEESEWDTEAMKKQNSELSRSYGIGRGPKEREAMAEQGRVGGSKESSS